MVIACNDLPFVFLHKANYYSESQQLLRKKVKDVRFLVRAMLKY